MMSEYPIKSVIKFSFIIPTFNRIKLVINAVDSAINFIKNDSRYEIIIIDDASTDGTYETIFLKYNSHISSGLIKVFRLDLNSGVVAARNVGALASRGSWLLFLDSDNEIIPDNKVDFENTLNATQNPCVLFRCVDDFGGLIGEKKIISLLCFNDAINRVWPEFFGVFNRRLFLSEYTKDDVVRLRRFESIAFFRSIKKAGPFQISDLAMRKYSLFSPDRLSSASGTKRDASRMLAGHSILLREHWDSMSAGRFMRATLACGYYAFQVCLNKFRSI